MQTVKVKYSYTAYCEKTIEIDDEGLQRYDEKDLDLNLAEDILRSGDQGEYDDVDVELSCSGPVVSAWSLVTDG